MSEPFLGEIKAVAFTFAPRGWAFCNGQLLQISQNQSLFSLLGTIYGGDGRTTFALPDLRGRAAMHFGVRNQGTKAGEETHVLTANELPSHTHRLQSSSGAAESPIPTGNRLASSPAHVHGAATNLTSLHPNSVATTGSGAHDNMQPFLVLHFIIALQGLFPSRN